MFYRICSIIIILLFIFPACSVAKEAAPASIQQPVVAGMFYEGTKGALKKQVEGYLNAAPKKKLDGHLLGLVAPHAGYKYSGAVAGYAFKQLEGRSYKTVVVMAPSHRVSLNGAALSTKDVYRTPLGDIPIDTEAVKNLIARNAWAADDQRPYQVEHSLEVELPFLQETLEHFKIVPVIIGTHSKTTLDAIADGLGRQYPGDDVLFIASTDLSHHKPYDEAVKADKKTLSYIMSGDAGACLSAEKSGDFLACGAGPTYVLMKIWKQRGGGKIDLLKYLNSGDTAGGKSKVVGYAAIAFLTEGSKHETRSTKHEKTEDTASFKLTAEQKQKLLTLARQTVEAQVRGKTLPSIKTDDSLLKANGATFVTLKKHGQLRGCIGHIIAREPLIENVRNMAVSAASTDLRFPPVRSDELKDIHVEVSVLTPPQPLNNPMLVNVGEDGLIIQRGFNRGVLLPQVPTELGWNKDQYLRGICNKAGMEPTCWKDAKLEKFQAIVFGE